MTEQLRSGSYTNSNISAKMANDLSPRKTMLILVIVAGCFAVLWPKVFYPMLVGSANQHMKPSSIDKTTGCCDVISETDINTIKIMSELCRSIIKRDEDTPLTGREIVAKCQNEVLETCGIDISAVLQEQVKLGQTVKQILDEVRSLNGSLCLKYNFGVSPWRLGVPHRITINPPSSNIRQERPLHVKSEMVHPAFRERGRAIPHPQPSTPSRPPPRIVEGRPGPIPAMRPTLGGAGHVVPPPKQSTGSMGLIMPIYTIGIVIFFTYTVMKIVFKKQPEALYPPVEPDPHFRREVFESVRVPAGPKLTRDGVSSKLGDAELDQLRRRLRETELAMERIVEQMAKVPLKLQDVVANGNVVNSQEEDQPTVKVLGMEMTASCEGGKKWSRPDTPVLPSSPPQAPEPAEPPQEIFLEGALPAQSHLLVADSATEAQKAASEEDTAVVLAGKMTLSVISLDSSENGTDESSNSGKKTDERSSSNISEEFEKIEIDSQLEDQINNIIEEAQLATDLVRKQEEPNLLEELENELKKIQNENVITNLEFQPPVEESIITDTIEKMEHDLALQDNGNEFIIKEVENELKKIENENVITKLDELHQAIEESNITDTIGEIDDLALQDNGNEFIVKEVTESEKQLFGNEPVLEKKVLEPEPKTEQEAVNVPAEISKPLTEEVVVEAKSIEPAVEKLEEKIDQQDLSRPEVSLEHDQEKNQAIVVEKELEVVKSSTKALEAEKNTQPSPKEKLGSHREPLFDMDPLESVIASLTSEKIELPSEKEMVILPEEIKEEIQTESVIQKPLVVQSTVTDIKNEIEPVLKQSDPDLGIKEVTPIFADNEIANEQESVDTPSEITPSDESDRDLRTEVAEEKIVQTPEDAIKSDEIVINTKEEPKPIVVADEKETFDKLNEAIADLSSEFKSANAEEKERLAPNATEEEEEEDEEEIEYEYEEESDNEAIDEEIRNVDRINDLGDQESIEHVNGDDQEQSKYVTTSSATLAENEISDEEDLENEDDEEEIEEIIEYITDEEEEVDEVIQPTQRNNVNHVNERSGANH